MELLLGTKVAFMQVLGAESCCVGIDIQSVPKHPVRTEKHLLCEARLFVLKHI